MFEEQEIWYQWLKIQQQAKLWTALKKIGIYALEK